MGDVYVMDEEGYFYYYLCIDDMIILFGYNIVVFEVEDVLM